MMRVRRDITEGSGQLVKPKRSSSIEFNPDSVSEVISRQEAWTEGDSDIKAGRDQFQAAALSNPVTDFLSNPKQHISDAIDAAIVVPETIKKFADTDVLDLRLSQGDQRRIEKFMKSLENIGKGLKKKMKAIKKQRGFRTNHPEWYGKAPELITSNLNYGVRKEQEDDINVAIGSKISICLTVPKKKGSTAQAYVDRINQNYQKLRGSNSGSYQYDPIDLAAYYECIRGIRAVHAGIARDVKLINNVDCYVSQSPDAILYVAGYDAAGIADLRGNHAQYVAAVNRYADLIRETFPVSPDMTVFNRTAYVASAVIEEGKGPKSSVFLYQVEHVYAPDGNGGNVLELYPTYATNIPAKLNILETLINRARTYQSANYAPNTFTKIAGDMMKAYGSAGFEDLDHISLSDRVEVRFDEYLLHQIQNSIPQLDTAQFSTNTTPSDVYGLIPSTQITIAGNANYTVPVRNVFGLVDSSNVAHKTIVNTNKKDISAMETISLTRDIVHFKVDTTDMTYGTAYAASVYQSGTDFIASVATYYYTKSTGLVQRFAMMSRGASAFPDEVSELWSQVDYSPILQKFDDRNNAGAFYVLFDMDTYAFMDLSQKEVFDDIATVSLYKTVDVEQQVNFRAVKR